MARFVNYERQSPRNWSGTVWEGGYHYDWWVNLSNCSFDNGRLRCSVTR